MLDTFETKRKLKIGRRGSFVNTYNYWVEPVDWYTKSYLKEQNMEIGVANGHSHHMETAPMHGRGCTSGSEKAGMRKGIFLDRCYWGRTGGVAITPFPKKSLMVPNLSRESCNDILK